MAANGSLNKEDTLLLIALAAGETVADAAKKAKMSERTAFRHQQKPEFQRQLSQLRGQMQAQAIGMLARISSDAAETLEALMGDDNPPTVRLGAARAILDLGGRLREQGEVEARLTAIEDAQAAEQTARSAA